MSAVIPSTTMGHHQYIPLAKLTPSPFNHRKRFDKVKMADLTENVRIQGVIVPIIARPLTGADRFEVVAGERRFRAATAAGLVDIPAIVRDLSDAQALEFQVIENGQREDVHPLEEAEGYEALMYCINAEGKKYTVDDIAIKVGKTKSTVYARMKLLALCPEGRKAFYDGELDASRALLIARIGHHDTQLKALKDVLKGEHGDGEPMSYREAQHHLQVTYMLKLSSAPFDIKDAQLLAKAGACGPCPKRTGNQTDLFGDVKSADVCTDPKCFDDKRQAHYGAAVRELEAKGKKVIYGDEAKKAFPDWEDSRDYMRENLVDKYLPMSGHAYVGHHQRAVRDIVGPDYQPLLIQHPATGKVLEVATKAAIDAGAKRTQVGQAMSSKAKSQAAKNSKPKGPDVDDMLTERLAQLIHKKAPKEFGKAWFVTLAGMLVKHLNTRDLEAVAVAWGWKASAFRPGGYGRNLPAEAAKLGERDLVLLMFHMIFAIGAFTRDPVLKLFGIKEKEIRELILDERKAAAKKAREEAKAKKPGAKVITVKPGDIVKPKPTKKAAKRAKGGKRRSAHAQFMKPMKPSAALAAIVGDKPLARTDITSKLWGYIKKHSLQDKTNRRMINADDKLRPIFKGKKQVSMFEMTKFVGKHLS